MASIEPMAMHRLVVLVLLFFGINTPSGAESALAKPPEKESFDIYLLMGQSNMVGRDTRGLSGQVDEPRVLAMDGEGAWRIARDPIHMKDSRIEPGVGPGISFALEMLKASPERSIGLVPCAVGGSPLKRWVKGGDLYEKALARAKASAKDGVIRGVLWLQGESDTEDEKNAASYEARLTGMFKDLRADLGSPDLPIVVGQLGEFLLQQPARFAHAETVRAAIRHMPEMLPRIGYADSAGLEHKGDQLHFSTAAEREFGQRFARAMTDLQSKVIGTSCELWREGKMPGKGSREPEGPRSPERTDAIRITNVSRPTLTLFQAPGEQKAPAVIVCPGGGYGYVVLDKEGSEVASWLNSKGITALVLKYRVPNNHMGALQDLQRALRLTRAKAAEWRIDPARVGVMGFSAGGHLAAWASTRFGEPAYERVDEVDGQNCRPDFAMLIYPAYLDDKQGGVSPDLDLKAEIPPTLIVHNEDDSSFITGSKIYHEALVAAKKPHEFLLYANGGHGYALRCTGEAKAWPEAASVWLAKQGVKP
ncbi:sialate O-acetylesterase [Luteolibacter luteus]|uniref:Alpha/beta hydrolase fold domain-containing protein n=1 Tax=Luteolibacter luteus TaxID=2728835 RepID=A0A858RQ71_9BACT|nr:sialate O-acetylesterase [Luteolibacter luteus]QJE98674.1 alpha/beta hydrolase fold domain-containing protein [Luteolibacter luteus]